MNRKIITVVVCILLVMCSQIPKPWNYVSAQEITQEFVDSFDEEEKQEKEGTTKQEKEKKKETISQTGNKAVDYSKEKKSDVMVEGNTTEEGTTQEEVVDLPKVSIEGIGELANVKEDVVLVVKVKSQTEHTEVSVEQEFAKEEFPGEKIRLPYNDTTTKKSKEKYTFSEEGRYVLVVTASDENGGLAKESKSFQIDRTAPELAGLDYLKEEKTSFSFQEADKNSIKDASHFEVTCSLDGMPYKGEEVKEEGNHIFQVRAVDAAGNESERKIDITIKKQDDKSKKSKKIKVSTEEVSLSEVTGKRPVVVKKLAAVSVVLVILFCLCTMKLFKKKG